MKNVGPSAFWTRLASKKNAFTVLLSAMLLLYAVFYFLELKLKTFSGGSGLIDTHCYFRPESLIELLEKYGPEGRRWHLIIFWTADLLFPVVYLFFFTVTMIRTGAAKWYKIPRFLALTDYMENATASILLCQYPDIQRNMVLTVAFFNGFKHVLTLLTIGIILFYWWKGKKGAK